MIAVLGGVFAAAPASADVPPEATVSYVALGDSFAAGTGAGDYTAESGWCHRSNNAASAVWGRQHPEIPTRSFACMGATTEDVLGDIDTAPKIAAALAGATKVTLTVGGNDVGFAHVVAHCLFGDGLQCAKYYDETTELAILRELPQKLDALYARLKVLAPFATVEVIGYPRIFDEFTECSSWSHSKQLTMNHGADLLSSVIQDSATRAGFTYIAARGVFYDHGVCSKDPWINDVGGSVTDTEWLHPTAVGQAAEAALIAAPQLAVSAALVDGRIEVTMLNKLHLAHRRVMIWLNGMYVGESYAGGNYYVSARDSQHTVMFTLNPPDPGVAAPGAHVQVGLVPGAPGWSRPPDPSTVPLLLDTTL